MLSIIISNYKPDLYTAVEKNIAQTVGLQYEIIKIDNPNKMSLCVAYNLGGKKAQYKNLLFLHDDVVFYTQNWGEILCDYLKDSQTGIIGIAGSNYVPIAPSGWFIKKEEGDLKKTEIEKVFAIDGVFMAVSKNHFEEILFNEKVKGYHGYDLDFSLRMAQKYQNYIIKDIHLDHLSPGKIDKAFLENNIQIRKTLGSDFQKHKNATLEKLAFINFLNFYFKYNQVTIKNLITTLNFFPISHFNAQNILAFLKTYLKVIRYQNIFSSKKN